MIPQCLDGPAGVYVAHARADGSFGATIATYPDLTGAGGSAGVRGAGVAPAEPHASIAPLLTSPANVKLIWLPVKAPSHQFPSPT